MAGAIVVPSEEDSYTFSVNAANEDAFKLRAVDARERQYWINRLRVVAQAHTQVLAEVMLLLLSFFKHVNISLFFLF